MPSFTRESGGTLHVAVMGVNRIGKANTSVAVSPEGKPATFINLYEGNKQSNWKRKIPSYSKVRYAKLYPDTDMWLSSAQGQLSYYFTIGASGNPEAIKMKFGRARSLKLDHKGNLEITLSNGGKLIHRVPKAFDLLNGNQRWLNSRFRIIGPDTVGFEIRGRRPGSQLTIDPIIDFGTYFGGSSDESGTSESSYFPEPKLDLDLLEDGDLLIGGTTLSTNLPEATGLISPTRNMAFAARLDPEHPSGDLFRYVSYFAGDNSDEAMGITTGPSNSAYLCGRTFSLNFPTRAAAFDVDSTLVENGAGFVLQIDRDGELFRTTFIRTV